MKVKVNTEIDLKCLFDAAHSQKEIHAMMEYLVPHASDETIINQVFEKGIVDGVVREFKKRLSKKDVQGIIDELTYDDLF
jgi:hypothetical protein